MIETNFYILNQEQFEHYNTEAKEVGVTLDYYLSEFCDVIGPMIEVD